MFQLPILTEDFHHLADYPRPSAFMMFPTSFPKAIFRGVVGICLYFIISATLIVGADKLRINVLVKFAELFLGNLAVRAE